MDFFSIKICLFFRRKFDRIQEGISKKNKKRATLLKQNVFVKLRKFNMWFVIKAEA